MKKNVRKQSMPATVHSLDFNNEGFLRFADYFFDGIVADWLVQDRINNARQQVDEAIRRVEQILRQL